MQVGVNGVNIVMLYISLLTLMSEKHPIHIYLSTYSDNDQTSKNDNSD